jgi:Protein of unknown function (DUF1631)
MTDSTSSTHNHAPTLGSKRLPKRVRLLLEGVLELTSNELERGLVSCLNDFEQQLFKFAEQARNSDMQARWLESQRLIKRTRHDLVPKFLISLEAELACVRDLGKRHDAGKNATKLRTPGAALALVDDLEMDESTIINEISSRAEMRSSLPLYLLSQRFGVLAGKPAFDSETNPVGPHSLCRMMKNSAECLGLSDEHRAIFFKTFEKQLLLLYAPLVESINAYLAKNGVLPSMQYVPVRPRANIATGDESKEKSSDGKTDKSDKISGESTGGDASARDENASGAAKTSFRGGAYPTGMPDNTIADVNQAPKQTNTTAAGNDKSTAAKGTHNPGASGQIKAVSSTEQMLAEDAFQQMRQLMASRKQLLGKLNPEKQRNVPGQVPVNATFLQKALAMLQGKPIKPIVTDGKPQTPGIQHIKQDLLSQLRQSSPDNVAPVLNDEDNDAIDLVGMLFESINKDVKPESPAAKLLAKLQVPLLRVALQDKGFFTRQNHPARQMLGTIAESGAYWLDDSDADPTLIQKMNTVVDRTVNDFDGDINLFQDLLQDLSGHLETLNRKAEVAEIRHIEAARGKEKLWVARDKAQTAVEKLLSKQSLPRFTQTLLSQAWTDVMALTALRHGEDSDIWKQQLGVAERLVQVAKTPQGQSSITASEATQLKHEIESSLSQVGYQQEEVQAISQRLVDPNGGSEDDAASRTELTMRLKKKARLGADLATDKTKRAKLTAEENARLELLKQTAFGTWFEFTINQQGDRVRRRMAWFSTTTGNCLFVNQRGQKVGEYMLDNLARMMVKGELSIVEEKAGSIVDRAWQSVMSALRSFTGTSGTEALAK